MLRTKTFNTSEHVMLVGFAFALLTTAGGCASRATRVQRCRDQAKLTEYAKNDQDATIRRIAADRLTDMRTLAYIRDSDQSPTVRQAAEKRHKALVKEAVYSGDTAAIGVALKTGASPAVGPWAFMLPDAIEDGNIESISLICKHVPPSARETLAEGFRRAVKARRLDITKLLVAEGHSIPGDRGVQYELLRKAIANEDGATAEFLLDQGCGVMYQIVPILKQSDLDASDRRSLALLLKYVPPHGADMMVHVAASHMNEAAINQLLVDSKVKPTVEGLSKAILAAIQAAVASKYQLTIDKLRGKHDEKAEIAKVKSIVSCLLQAGGNPSQFRFASYARGDNSVKRTDHGGAVAISIGNAPAKFGPVVPAAEAKTGAVTAEALAEKEGLTDIAKLIRNRRSSE